MFRSGIIAWTLGLGAFVKAQGQQDPGIIAYLKPVVSVHAADKNAGAWNWVAAGQGGYLMRMLMDVTGDGCPELFLATSLAQNGNAPQWTVFDVSSSRQMRPYSEVVSLMEGALWVTKNGHSIELKCEWLPDFDSDEGVRNRSLPEDEVKHRISVLTFDFPTIEQGSILVTDGESQKMKSAPGVTKPRLETMLLADYLANPEAKWQPIAELQANSSSCFFRSEDAPRLERLRTFTPQAALERINELLGSTGAVRKADRSISLDRQGSSENLGNFASPEIAESGFFSASKVLGFILAIAALVGAALFWKARRDRK